MAFPAVESFLPAADNNTGGATVSGEVNGSSHSVTLPPTISAGSLLVVFGRCMVAGTIAITGGGWTIVQDSSDGSDDVTFWAYRNTLAVGNEDGTTITVTHGAASKLTTHTFSITGAADPATQAPQSSTVAIGATTTPNPTTCTPTGGAKDYLWLWLAAWDGEQTLSKTIATNYTDHNDTSTGTASTVNGQQKAGSRQLNAASEDAGTITLSAAPLGWTAWVIGIHPAPTPTATTVARVSLESGNTPDTRTAHSIKVRARKASGSGAVVLKAALYESSNNRSGDLSSSALTTSFADYSLAIGDTEADDITSYSDLEIRFWATCVNGDVVDVDVAEIYLEAPTGADAPRPQRIITKSQARHRSYRW